jgi:PAS domain S-box-containing protein
MVVPGDATGADGLTGGAPIVVFRDGLATRDPEPLGWLGMMFDQHGARAYNLALQMVHRREEAGAIVERAFRMLAGRHAATPDAGDVGAFLLDQVRGLAAAALAAAMAPAVLGAPDPALADSAPIEVGEEAGQHLLAAIPGLQRRALELARGEGLTRGEIAERLGLGVPEVTTLLADAMYSLRGIANARLRTTTDRTRASARPVSEVPAALAAWRVAERAMARLEAGDPGYPRAVVTLDRTRTEFHAAVARMAALLADDQRASPAAQVPPTSGIETAAPTLPEVPSSDRLTVVRAWVAGQERIATDTEQVIVVTDEQRRYVAVSANICGLLGYQPNEVIGRRIEDLAAPKLVAATPTLWNRFIAVTHDAMTFALLAKDGRVVTVRYDATADYPLNGFHTSRLWPLSGASPSG